MLILQTEPRWHSQAGKQEKPWTDTERNRHSRRHGQWRWRPTGPPTRKQAATPIGWKGPQSFLNNSRSKQPKSLLLKVRGWWGEWLHLSPHPQKETKKRSRPNPAPHWLCDCIGNMPSIGAEQKLLSALKARWAVHRHQTKPRREDRRETERLWIEWNRQKQFSHSKGARTQKFQSK